MRPLIPALAASALIAAALVWTPLPGPAAGAAGPSAPAPSAIANAPPPRIGASPAAAYVRFAPDLAAAGGAAGAPAAPKPGPPVLVGLAGEGRTRTAYIMDAGQPLRARVGDKVGRWRLAAIGPHSVTLRSGGKSMQLAFYGPRAEPPPLASPPTAEAEAAAPAAAPAAEAAPAAPPVRAHALEPASAPAAPPPPRARPGQRYWAGPPGSAPPGYIVLKPGQAPPQ